MVANQLGCTSRECTQSIYNELGLTKDSILTELNFGNQLVPGTDFTQAGIVEGFSGYDPASFKQSLFAGCKATVDRASTCCGNPIACFGDDSEKSKNIGQGMNMALTMGAMYGASKGTASSCRLAKQISEGSAAANLAASQVCHKKVNICKDACPPLKETLSQTFASLEEACRNFSSLKYHSSNFCAGKSAIRTAKNNAAGIQNTCLAQKDKGDQFISLS